MIVGFVQGLNHKKALVNDAHQAETEQLKSSLTKNQSNNSFEILEIFISLMNEA